MRKHSAVRIVAFLFAVVFLVANIQTFQVKADTVTTVVMTYEDKVFTKELYSVDTEQIKAGVMTDGLKSIGDLCDNLKFQTNGQVEVDKNSVMDFVKNSIIAGKVNINVDLTQFTPKALASIKQAMTQTAPAQPQASAAAAPAAPSNMIDNAALNAMGIDCKISEASTKFRANEDRAVNVRNAASKINGMIIMPGYGFSADLSFGPRTVENGYGQGNVISGGKYVKAMGGGICQVSSTLNLAVLRAGIIPTVRRNHSHRSSYIGSGLDATISAGTIDYQFINTLPYPIFISATGDGGVLNIAIYSNHDALGGVKYEPSVVGSNLNNTTYLIGTLNGVQVSNRRCYSSKYSQ